MLACKTMHPCNIQAGGLLPGGPVAAAALVAHQPPLVVGRVVQAARHHQPYSEGDHLLRHVRWHQRGQSQGRHSGRPCTSLPPSRHIQHALAPAGLFGEAAGELQSVAVPPPQSRPCAGLGGVVLQPAVRPPSEPPLLAPAHKLSWFSLLLQLLAPLPLRSGAPALAHGSTRAGAPTAPPSWPVPACRSANAGTVGLLACPTTGVLMAS
jgi:hypothetical protein